MFLLIKDVFIVVVALVSSLLISFGLVSDPALAPDMNVPSTVTVSETATTTEPVSVIDVTDGEKIEKEAPTEPVDQPETPLITDYEKSLQEALDALATLQQEQQTVPVVQGGLNETVRSAVVNILCTTAGAGPLSPISASGVVVDSRGIVLTNAHVAQYFLLKNYPTPNFVECIIRTGSPAYPTYRAELLFLPPSWIAKNAQKIDDERPTGNGEHDYALLRITKTVADENVPLLPYLPLLVGSPQEGSSVLLAGYPAGFLGGATIAKELYAVSANSTVGNIYTFDTNTIDLFSIGGSVVAQQGSSGGAVAQATAESPNGAALVGLIVTSSDAETTSERDLRALSTQYIIRDFERERGLALADYLGLNLAEEQARFQLTTVPTLTTALTNVLGQ